MAKAALARRLDSGFRDSKAASWYASSLMTGNARTKWTGGLLLLALAAAPACSALEGKTCTRMGCGPTLAIELTEPLAAQGTYRFEIVSDDAQVTCSGGTLADAGARECEGVFGWVQANPSGALTGVYVDLRPPPRSVTVTLLKDDTPIAVETFEPSYTGREINGPGCGKCYQATVSLDTGAL